jgi:hypothetical protein
MNNHTMSEEDQQNILEATKVAMEIENIMDGKHPLVALTALSICLQQLHENCFDVALEDFMQIQTDITIKYHKKKQAEKVLH